MIGAATIATWGELDSHLHALGLPETAEWLRRLKDESGRYKISPFDPLPDYDTPAETTTSRGCAQKNRHVRMRLHPIRRRRRKLFRNLSEYQAWYDRPLLDRLLHRLDAPWHRRRSR